MAGVSARRRSPSAEMGDREDAAAPFLHMQRVHQINGLAQCVTALAGEQHLAKLAGCLQDLGGAKPRNFATP